MASAVDRALRVLAVVLLASMLVSALHDVSQAWDSGYYHLPFAARLGGVLSADEYAFGAANQARFEGFPLLAELAQGILWRLTGRPESANLVAFASVPLFAWFARRRFAIPWHLTVVALLAVPIVHTHAAAAYVDLPANAAMAALALLAMDAWARPAPPPARDLAAALALAAVAVNTKALLHPLVALALVALGARALPALARAKRWRAIALALGALPLAFATPLKNLAFHGNPYFPVRISILGRALPGVEDPYASSPDWLAHAARPFRFLASLLEIGLRPMSDPRRWTVDQWAPSDSPALRMGGFFHAYVVALVAFVAWRVWRTKSREARVLGAGFAAFTAAVSVMPQSHELRYYMCWMIALVALALRLAERKWALGALGAAALAVVLVVTRGVYAYPSGSTWAELVRERVDARALDRIGDGEHVCVTREPWNIAWAARFHAPKRYVVRDAEIAEECAGWRRVE